MSVALHRHRLVLRYVYALLAIVIVVSAAFITALFAEHQIEVAVHDRTQDYHQASAAVADNLHREAHHLAEVLDRTYHARDISGPDVSGTLIAMRDDIFQLGELQAEYGDPMFVATLERLISCFEAMQRLIAESTPAAVVAESISTFELASNQLYRLHIISAANELAELKARASRHIPNLAILAVILALAVLMGWLATRLLRRSLIREVQAEHDLAESRERMHHMQKLEALGQLVGGVAHDFNNLLTAILGQTRLLGEQYSDHRNMRLGLDEINEAAQQAASLTRQLLAFSRRQPVTTRPVDLNELLQMTEPMLRRLIGEDIAIEFRYGTIDKAVELDPGQLHQVTLNLLINARDALPDGGRVLVDTQAVHFRSDDMAPGEMTGGSYAKLTVTDNGVGMSEEMIARVFEPFFTTKQRGRGTGLGLATVHGIVTAANGHIFVDSAPGKGTRFEVYWPTTDKPAETIVPEQPHTRRGTETILVVEDEEQIRKLLQKGLGALGYRILTAADGASALQICRDEPSVDLIISDVIMPNMNGVDLMQQALPLQPGAVGIFMSGYTDDVTLQRGVAGSDIPLINKPFELGTLATVIRERLDSRTTGDAHRLEAAS